MSNLPTNDPDDDYERHSGPLGRMRSIARFIFGLWGLFGVVAIVVGLCVVAYGIFHEISGR
jgi:hypothetical protein